MTRKNKPIHITVSSIESKQRIDAIAKYHLSEFSRNTIQKWLKSGAILCNGSTVTPSKLVNEGDVIAGAIPEEEISLIPEKISLSILYEDSDLLVVNKPAGMVVHPAVGNHKGTLANALVYHLNKKKNLKSKKLKGIRPGIVHRLDKETSGLLVIAKNSVVMDSLSRQFADRSVKKVYRALVFGQMKVNHGEIEGSIGRDHDTQKMTLTTAGRFARTDFKVLERFSGATYLEVYPKTGRTHQIRVHLANIGHPVIGDKVYSKYTPEKDPDRQMLHAYKLSFSHPKKKKEMTFTAPIPKDFSHKLKQL